MILFEIYSPKPNPDSDLVANLVNSLGIISGSMPVPVSFMQTIAHVFVSLSSIYALLLIALSTNRVDMVILPLFFLVALIALHSKLEMTSFILTLSAFTNKGLA